MPKSPLDELKSLLRSRWVKPRYAVRALRELEDHLADLEAAARERGLSPADAQAVAARDLGDVRVIADQLVQGLQRHTSVGQHPWLVFGALPLPLFVALRKTVGYFDHLDLRALVQQPKLPWYVFAQEGTHNVITLARALADLGLPALLVLGFCALADRSTRGPRFALLSTALVATGSLLWRAAHNDFWGAQEASALTALTCLAFFAWRRWRGRDEALEAEAELVLENAPPKQLAQ